MKEWFKARTLWGAAIMALSDTEAGRLAKALWAYTMSGEEQDLSGAEKGIFAMIRMQLSQDDARESEISEKRSAAGSAGAMRRLANHANADFASANADDYANAGNKNKKENDISEKEIKKEKAKRFTPPSLDDVRSYCVERKNDVDPEKFVDFYASKGWKVGNQPMKDWKACVRTWEGRSKNNDHPAKSVVAQQYPQRTPETSNETPEEMLNRLFSGGRIA